MQQDLGNIRYKAINKNPPLPLGKTHLTAEKKRESLVLLYCNAGDDLVVYSISLRGLYHESSKSRRVTDDNTAERVTSRFPVSFGAHLRGGFIELHIFLVWRVVSPAIVAGESHRTAHQ